MPAETETEEALRLIRQSQYKVGPEWKKAHEIAQRNEGHPVFDAIHALVHRIEGDTSNAAYWDRRAGTDFGAGGAESELSKIEALARQS